MLEVVAEEPSLVPLVENDDVVEAFATDASDHTLHEGILPGAPRGGEHFFDAHALHPGSESRAVDAVAIPDQVARCRLPWERLGDLLAGSLGRRVLRHVEVHDPAPRVNENDEQDLERHRWHHEEVDGQQSFTWLSRKARHVGDDGFFGRTMYFSTVDLATWRPSLASSPTMRGEPQRGFALDIFRMSTWTALATAGLPGAPWARQAQWSRNLRLCQAITVLGWTKTRASR